MKAITIINGNVELVDIPDKARSWTRIESPSLAENPNQSLRQDSWHGSLTRCIIKAKKHKR